jgi:hypothetical protein
LHSSVIINVRFGSGIATLGIDLDELVIERDARVDVHEDRLVIRLKSVGGEEASDAADVSQSLGRSRHPGNPGRFLSRAASPKAMSARRGSNAARLVSAIARSRRWLNKIVSGSVTDAQQIAARQKCSVTISLTLPRPGSRQSGGRRAFAAWHWSRNDYAMLPQRQAAKNRPERLQAALETKKSGTIPAKIPAETAVSTTVSAV